MQYIFFIIILFPLKLFSIQENSIHRYNGIRFDLIDRDGWTLYSGFKQDLIGENLKHKQFAGVIKEKEGLWTLENKIIIRKAEIPNDGIWLQLLGDFTAVHSYINDSLLFTNGKFDMNGDILEYGNIQHIQLIPNSFIKDSINSLRLVFTTKGIGTEFRIRDYAFNSYNTILERQPDRVFQPLFIAGFLLLAVFINLSLYYAYGKQMLFLLLAFYFLSDFTGLSVEAYYWAANPSILYKSFLLFIMNYSSILAKFLLLMILAIKFELKKRNRLRLFVPAFLIYLFFIEFLSYEPFVLLIYIVCLSFWAYVKGKTDSALITASLFILLIFSLICDYCLMSKIEFISNNTVLRLAGHYLDKFAVLIFAMVMIYTVSRKILILNKKYDESQIKSSRLENELVQKHIQPHFIMNSLMSLQELIDVDQKKAGDMIESLSKEFHSLARNSKKKLIPMKDELDICRAHLEIMEHQQDAKFKLETVDINGNEMIPPAIIHTLIENGLTHGYSGKEDGYFQLKKIETDKEIRYSLFNNSRAGKQLGESKGSGTGLRYIEARLEESYGQNWSLSSKAVHGGWESLIVIRKD